LLTSLSLASVRFGPSDLRPAYGYSSQGVRGGAFRFAVGKAEARITVAWPVRSRLSTPGFAEEVPLGRRGGLPLLR
jgi:hypothetical protein